MASKRTSPMIVATHAAHQTTSVRILAQASEHHTTKIPSTAFPLHPSAPMHGFAACEYIHLSVISLEFASQDQASFLRVMMPRHWVTSCRRCEITEGSHLQGHIFYNCYARWFGLRWEVGTGYHNCLRNTAY